MCYSHPKKKRKKKKIRCVKQNFSVCIMQMCFYQNEMHAKTRGQCNVLCTVTLSYVRIQSLTGSCHLYSQLDHKHETWTG